MYYIRRDIHTLLGYLTICMYIRQYAIIVYINRVYHNVTNFMDRVLNDKHYTVEQGDRRKPDQKKTIDILVLNRADQRTTVT